MNTRADGRRSDEIRAVQLEVGYQKFVAGSVLIRWGDTNVLCAASVEESVPAFRLESGGGWLTAEYSMLPGSTVPRKRRRIGGRETEIQRLIGRALRAAVDLDAIGPRTIHVDCDVLQADGGTRVAAITGGLVAVALALERLSEREPKILRALRCPVAAVSVGVVDGQALLDLPYAEDSRAEVDMNLVMTADGQIVEVQGAAERETFSRQQLDELLELAHRGIRQLCQLQVEQFSPELQAILRNS